MIHVRMSEVRRNAQHVTVRVSTGDPDRTMVAALGGLRSCQAAQPPAGGQSTMAVIAAVNDQPATCQSADGSTTLYGYRIAAIIYAPTKREATRRLEHSLELDVGEIVGRVPDDSRRAAKRPAAEDQG